MTPRPRISFREKARPEEMVWPLSYNILGKSNMAEDPAAGVWNRQAEKDFTIRLKI